MSRQKNKDKKRGRWMKVRVPHYYDMFYCTGSRCPDTCCVGWMIEIDDSSYERFWKMEGEFGERIRKNIIERTDGRYFALNENGRCAFLNQDNLCEMVIKLGEESLCSLCDNYPRVGVEFGGLREMGLSLSCPEVSRLVFSSSSPIKFGEWYQKEETLGPDYTRDAVFVSLMDARDVLFGILQNRRLSIADRGSLYLMMASKLQSIIDEDVLGNFAAEQIQKTAEKFSDEEYLKKAVCSIKGASREQSREFLKTVFSFLDKLEIINEKWLALFHGTRKMLESQEQEEYEKEHAAFRVFYRDNEYVYEHLMVYYVYRYFMKMIFDGDIYSKAVMCVVSLMVIHEMDVSVWRSNGGSLELDDRVRVMYLFSKEIEHCEENMERLAEEFWDNEIYRTQSVIDNVINIL